ncbi:MAG TPA: M3 family metallopeptidase, partial [Nocardioidaceae bacterium]|nr:M3 family metallopeptidase [Nocardioidaceae bacterium]
MTLAPLALPAADGYLSWLAERCDTHLALARELIASIKSGPGSAYQALRTWNDVNLAIKNVLAVSELMANVHPDEPVRELAERAEQDAKRLLSEIGLDRDLYDVLAAADSGQVDEGGRRVLEMSLRDFRRAGVDRDEATRERAGQLHERITELRQEFDRNIRDGHRSIRVAPDALAGLPQDYIEDHLKGDDGLVAIGIDYPDFIPMMTFATDRDLRRKVLRLFLDRGWPENDPVLAEMLGARQELARLLGYSDWPSFDAEVKMISAGPAILEFIDRISEVAGPSARRDYQLKLDRLQHDHPDATTVEHTDRLFYGEVVRREEYDVDAQEVRQYFDFAKVRAGLLSVTGRLFGLVYDEVPDAPRWHDDVAVYDVRADEGLIGRIYLDLNPRPGKYSHAAQFDLVPGVAGRQLAEGVLVCNLPRGLMDHDDVVVLFHEFGHLVHQVLSGRHEWVRFSGIATEWDFIEAPSMMLEEWAWTAEVLQTFATNAAGEPIPGALVERMHAASDFGRGLWTRTQLFYSAMSYRLHQDVPEDLAVAMEELQGRYDQYAALPGTHLHAGFGHLGDYSSGYYTYIWSLVIAKDLFSEFDRADLFATEVA